MVATPKPLFYKFYFFGLSSRRDFGCDKCERQRPSTVVGVIDPSNGLPCHGGGVRVGSNEWEGLSGWGSCFANQEW